MTALARDSEANSPEKRNRGSALLAAWATLVSLFFFWESVQYAGLSAWMAEWQFATFGTYFPVLTYLLFVALFCIPLFLVAIYRWRRDRKTIDLEMRNGGRALAASTRMMRTLFSIAVGVGFASLGALIVTAALPDVKGAAQRIIVGSEASLSPAEGAATLVGNNDLKLTAGLGQDLTFFGRKVYFAPVRATVGDSNRVTYFVEVEKIGNKPVQFRPVDSGILRRNALPGELVGLYRNAKVNIGEPYFVLFKSHEGMRWRHLVVVIQLALLATLFLLFGLAQRYRRNRLRRELNEQLVASAS